MLLRRFLMIAAVMVMGVVVFAHNNTTPAQANTCLSTPFEGGCYSGIPIVEYQQLLDEMMLYPEPRVEQLPPNERELRRFDFRRLINPEGTTIFNGPNGSPVSSIAPGFNYISVISSQDGWIEINRGQWVRESDTASVRPSTFSGVLVDPTAPYTMAWMLYPVRPSTYPGGPENTELPRVARYTRLNIYHSVDVDGWRWYLVGPEQWIKQVNVGKVLYTERPENVKGRWFAIDLYEQVLVAYEDDIPVFATLVSTGLPQWETNEGTFSTWARIAIAPMSGAEGQEDFYSLQNVPWTLYFDNDISIHGTYWHDGFGYRHSHGCVNLTLTDSHWVFHWSQEAGYDKPQVHVWASGEYR